MKIKQLKTIDNILGITSSIVVIASVFYRPLIYEASILSLTYTVFDIYVSIKTSEPDFIFDLLFIIGILIYSFLAPGNIIIILLSTLILNATNIPMAILITISILAILVFLVHKIMKLIDSLQEDIIEL